MPPTTPLSPLSLSSNRPSSPPSHNRRNDRWSPETSPTSSEGDNNELDSDLNSITPSPSSHSLSSSTMAEHENQPTSRISTSPPSSTSDLNASGPSTRPYRPTTMRPMTRTPSLSPPKVNLPKSQPLSRALFARMAMAEIPHAGMSNGGSGSKKVGGGKQKMIVATKPMRTTFELGLTSSELARRG